MALNSISLGYGMDGYGSQTAQDVLGIHVSSIDGISNVLSQQGVPTISGINDAKESIRNNVILLHDQGHINDDTYARMMDRINDDIKSTNFQNDNYLGKNEAPAYAMALQYAITTGDYEQANMLCQADAFDSFAQGSGAGHDLAYSYVNAMLDKTHNNEILAANELMSWTEMNGHNFQPSEIIDMFGSYAREVAANPDAADDYSNMLGVAMSGLVDENGNINYRDMLVYASEGASQEVVDMTLNNIGSNPTDNQKAMILAMFAHRADVEGGQQAWAVNQSKDYLTTSLLAIGNDENRLNDMLYNTISGDTYGGYGTDLPITAEYMSQLGTKLAAEVEVASAQMENTPSYTAPAKEFPVISDADYTVYKNATVQALEGATGYDDYITNMQRILGDQYDQVKLAGMFVKDGANDSGYEATYHGAPANLFENNLKAHFADQYSDRLTAPAHDVDSFENPNTTSTGSNSQTGSGTTGSTTTNSATVDSYDYGNDQHGAARVTEGMVTPQFDTHAFDKLELSGDDINKIIDSAVNPMGYPSGSSDPAFNGMPIETAKIDAFKTTITDAGFDVSKLSKDELIMLAVFNDNGMFDKDGIANYMNASEAERNDIMKSSLISWLNNPGATGKDMLVSNLSVESMIGMEGGALDRLNLQSIDCLFGSNKDGHVNTFFYNGINADALYNANVILDNMHDRGDLDDDAYYSACESWEADALNMAFMANSFEEAQAAHGALTKDFMNDHGPGSADNYASAEACLKEYVEAQGWDWNQFKDDMQNPEFDKNRDGDGQNAYRRPMVNGEMAGDEYMDALRGQFPDNVPDKYRDAYNLKLLDNMYGEYKAPGEAGYDTYKNNVTKSNDLLHEALTAGIHAFRDVLGKSAEGQKILMMCNEFVHRPPINGTLFQEIWDLNQDVDSFEVTKAVKAYSMTKEPDPTIPGTTEPDPTEPDPTEPDPTEPDPTEPDPTEPDPTEPDPTEPDPTEPDPTEPDPTEPDPTEPDPTEPDPTEPDPTEPDPTEPDPTEPDPTEPDPTEPDPTEPDPTEPDPTEPDPTEPDPTNPGSGPEGTSTGADDDRIDGEHVTGGNGSEFLGGNGGFQSDTGEPNPTRAEVAGQTEGGAVGNWDDIANNDTSTQTQSDNGIDPSFGGFGGDASFLVGDGGASAGSLAAAVTESAEQNNAPTPVEEHHEETHEDTQTKTDKEISESDHEKAAKEVSYAEFD